MKSMTTSDGLTPGDPCRNCNKFSSGLILHLYIHVTKPSLTLDKQNFQSQLFFKNQVRLFTYVECPSMQSSSRLLSFGSRAHSISTISG